MSEAGSSEAQHGPAALQATRLAHLGQGLARRGHKVAFTSLGKGEQKPRWRLPCGALYLVGVWAYRCRRPQVVLYVAEDDMTRDAEARDEILLVFKTRGRRHGMVQLSIQKQLVRMLKSRKLG